MIPQTTHVPVPWDEVAPRVPDQEQGRPSGAVHPHGLLCLDCALPDCEDTSPRCLLRQHGWLDSNGRVMRPTTRAVKLNALAYERKATDREVRAVRRLMGSIGR